MYEYLKSNPGGIPEAEAARLFREILYAVNYMHDLGIVHRDIKCENILLVDKREEENIPEERVKPRRASLPSPLRWVSEEALFDSELPLSPPPSESSNSGHVPPRKINSAFSSLLEAEERKDLSNYTCKLADFGLSTYFTDRQNSSPEPSLSSSTADCCVGSVHYCSPEEIRNKSSADPASDIWSIGCVLFAMITGRLPFSDDYLPRLQMAIINGRYDKSLLDKASSGVVDLISRMLQVKVEDRATMSEIVHHPWVLGEKEPVGLGVCEEEC